jgi:hypothetical protein
VDLPTYLKKFRVKSALKVVLAAVICILVNNILHLDAIYLAELYTFLILTLFHGQALKVGIESLVAAIGFASLSLGITYLFLDSKVIYIILMSLLLFLCMTFIKKYFLATLLSGVLIAITTYMAVNESVTEATNTAQNFVLQMVLAVIVCWIVDDYIWPHRSRKTFDLTLSTIFSELGNLYQNYTSRDTSRRYGHNSISTALVTFSGLMNLLKRVESEEGKSKYFPVGAYIKMVTFGRGIYIKTEVLEEYVLKQHDFLSDADVSDELNKILLNISGRFRELSDAVSGNREVRLQGEDIESSINSLHDCYKRMHEVKGEEVQYYEDLLAFGAMLPVLDEVNLKLSKIEKFYNLIQRNEYHKMLKQRVTHAPEVEEIKSKPFFQFNDETVKVGIRTVIIYWLLILGQVTIDLPGGALVSFYAILFGIIPNLGQAFMKSGYGIAGIVAGIVFGFIALIIVSFTPHFLILLLLFCVGFFIASFVTTSPRDISAAGLQAGLVIPYALLYTTGPQVDLDAAFTRFLALLSAAFIGLIVLRLVWPVNPYTQLKQNISKALRVSGGILSKLLIFDIKDKEKIDALVVPLAASLPTSSALLHDAEYIIREEKLHAEEYLHIIESLEVMFADLETIKRTVYSHMDNELFHLYLSHLSDDYKTLCGHFYDVAGAVLSSSNRDMTAQISDLKVKIEEGRREFRDTENWRRFEPRDIEMNVLITTSIDSMLESLYKISCHLNTINGIANEQGVTLQTSETMS